MTDEEYRELQGKALAAAALLESDTWRAAHDAVCAAIFAEWAAASWGAPSIREQKYAEIKGLHMVRDRLQGWINESRFEHDAREKRRLRAA